MHQMQSLGTSHNQSTKDGTEVVRRVGADAWLSLKGD